MVQDYFIYNGVKYDAGTVIIIKWCNSITRTVLNTNAIFISYNTENKEYTVEIYGDKYIYAEDIFFKLLCGVVNTNNNVCNKANYHTFVDELNIDNMLNAWIWYLGIMAFAFIFYSRISIWIFASIVFFNYRNNKLKEAGYK